MEKGETTNTQLGMLFGIFIGGGIGVLLFVFCTKSPVFHRDWHRPSAGFYHRGGYRPQPGNTSREIPTSE